MVHFNLDSLFHFRTLQPGEIHPPFDFGEWVVLLRLEQLTTAKFDKKMKDFLLNQQIDEFLDKRVASLIKGETLDPLHFDAHQ